jgi:hypothetical protein
MSDVRRSVHHHIESLQKPIEDVHECGELEEI